ncbi:MAG: RNA polymerase subunit sigma-70 [Bacteroides sp. SM23_62_1]|nr:MAG: RNA polymerase subunit sigma-70 [Bacteroides sp. SM23_62_1]
MIENGLKKRFLELVNQHKVIIHKISRIYGDTPEDREDLFQEILLNLWKGYPSFRGESKFSTWLYRITLNTCITLYRKKSRSPKTDSISDQHRVIPDDINIVGNGEELRLLYSAIDKLDKLEKAIIILYLEEKSYEEIAEIVGITPNHTGVKISRIREKLRKYFKNENT